MTFIASFHLEDHIILVSDHRASMVHTTVDKDDFNNHVVFSNNYPKMRVWAEGVVINTGDCLLYEYFYDELLKIPSGGTLDIMKAATTARENYQAFYFGSATYNHHNASCIIVFTCGLNDTLLFEVDIEPLKIEFKTMPSGTMLMGMFESLGDDFYLNLYKSFGPASHFDSIKEFADHHLDLIKTIYYAQQRLDPSISTTFDICVTCCKTGKTIMKTFMNEDSFFNEGNIQQLESVTYNPAHDPRKFLEAYTTIESNNKGDMVAILEQISEIKIPASTPKELYPFFNWHIEFKIKP